MKDGSPRDRVITVFGRVPVAEALADSSLGIERVFVSRSARGENVRALELAAARRGIPVLRVEESKVTRVARNGKQHQGVAADVVAPRMRSLPSWVEGLDRDAAGLVVLLDGITTPANVGMIIRAAVASGVDGIVLPEAGVARLGPLVIKASAGTAFRAPILRVGSAEEACALLEGRGFELLGLDQTGEVDLWDIEAPARAAVVLGGESGGLSAGVKDRLRRRVVIPMGDGVESLNVATAAAICLFQLRRPRRAG